MRQASEEAARTSRRASSAAARILAEAAVARLPAAKAEEGGCGQSHLPGRWRRGRKRLFGGRWLWRRILAAAVLLQPERKAEAARAVWGNFWGLRRDRWSSGSNSG
jgi:hypothetical protein